MIDAAAKIGVRRYFFSSSVCVYRDMEPGEPALDEGDVRQVLLELRDAVVFFNLRGQPVKLKGLGAYTPTIKLDGKTSDELVAMWNEEYPEDPVE